MQVMSRDVTARRLLPTDEATDLLKLVRDLATRELTDAIETALKQEKGQAVAAKFELTEANKPEGMVRVFNNGKIRFVTLDGETGKITSVKDGP